MIRCPAFLSRLVLVMPLLATAGLAACASAGTSAPRAVVAVEKPEPLPSGIKPLTLEQEEAVGE